MDGNNEMVTCCFCGLPLEYNKAVILQIYPDVNEEETQQLFCHREHLRERIHNSVPLHPDLLADS